MGAAVAVPMVGADLYSETQARAIVACPPSALDRCWRRPRRWACRRGRRRGGRRGSGGEERWRDPARPVGGLHEIWSTALPGLWDSKNMCGIFGIDGSTGSDDAANLTYLGLYALQHRGQESTGMVSWDGTKLHLERGMATSPTCSRKRRWSACGATGPSATPVTRPRAPAWWRTPSHRGENLDGLDRHRPQRQPDESERDPRPPGAGRLDLPDHQRHRGDPPPDGAQSAQGHRGVLHARPGGGARRLLAAAQHRHLPDRGARPHGFRRW